MERIRQRNDVARFDGLLTLLAPQPTIIAPKKCGAVSLPAANSEDNLCASDSMLTLIFLLLSTAFSSSSSPSSPLPLWPPVAPPLAAAAVLPPNPSPNVLPGRPLRVLLSRPSVRCPSPSCPFSCGSRFFSPAHADALHVIARKR